MDRPQLIARCGICFKENAECQPISYPSIVEVFKLCNIAPIAIACCSECLKSDPQELHQSITDFIIIDQMWAYVTGKREGIIYSDAAYKAFREEAIANGVFERESRRQEAIGNPGINFEPLMNKQISVNLTERTDGFHTELLLRAMFKKTHEKN